MNSLNENVLFLKIKNIIEKKLTPEELELHLKSYEKITGLTFDQIHFSDFYSYDKNQKSKKRKDIPLIGVGYKPNFYSLYHEFSHLIEIVDTDPEKIFKEGFDLNCTTKIKVNDNYYEQPITTQASERECRVLAIQIKLMSHIFNIEDKFLLDYFLKNEVSSLKYVHDFYNIKIDDNSTLSLKEQEEYRINVLKNIIKKEFNTISIEEILKKIEKVNYFKNYKKWTDEELLEYAYHNVSIEALKEIVNPLNCWIELQTPITKEDVLLSLKNKEYALNETKIWFEDMTEDRSKKRIEHINKIAFFVKNKPQKPISIDLGTEPDYINVNYIIDDGNHRLAGSIIKGRETIKAHISGNTNLMKSLGLYSPNFFEAELERRYDEEYKIYLQELNEKYQNKISNFVKIIKKTKEIILNREQFNEYCDIFDNYFFKFKKDQEFNKDELFLKSLKVEYLSDYNKPLKIINTNFIKKPKLNN